MKEQIFNKIGYWKMTTLANFMAKNNDYDCVSLLDHMYLFFNDEKNKSLINRIQRISVPDMEKMTNKYMKSQRSNYINSCDKKIISFDNGYFWIQLETFEEYQAEGALMKNCVAGRFELNKSVDKVIFSLRDSNNKPKIDLEYSTKLKLVLQVKAKCNNDVDEDHIEYVQELLCWINKEFGIKDSMETEFLLQYQLISINNGKDLVKLSESMSILLDDLILKEYNKYSQRYSILKKIEFKVIRKFIRDIDADRPSNIGIDSNCKIEDERSYAYFDFGLGRIENEFSVIMSGMNIGKSILNLQRIGRTQRNHDFIVFDSIPSIQLDSGSSIVPRGFGKSHVLKNLFYEAESQEIKNMNEQHVAIRMKYLGIEATISETENIISNKMLSTKIGLAEPSNTMLKDKYEQNRKMDRTEHNFK